MTARRHGRRKATSNCVPRAQTNENEHILCDEIGLHGPSTHGIDRLFLAFYPDPPTPAPPPPAPPLPAPVSSVLLLHGCLVSQLPPTLA